MSQSEMAEPTLAYLTSTQQWENACKHLSTLPGSSSELSSTHANWTALHHAASANPTPDLLQQLLEHGASPHVTGAAGSTPLHLAAWHGTNAVEKLISAGADGNARTEAGRTPLHFAARQGHSHVVKSLLEAGCVDCADVHGVTAKEMAVKNGLDEVVKVFEEFEEVEEDEEERSLGDGMRERVKSFVGTVSKDVVVAGGVGFLLGALVPRRK